MALSFPGITNIFPDSSAQEEGFSQKPKTIKYWSCDGSNFKAENPDTDSVHYQFVPLHRVFEADVNTIYAHATVFLPDNAEILSAVVYGNAATEDSDWLLVRTNILTQINFTITTAKVNTESYIVNNQIVDNSTFSLRFFLTVLSANDEIWGARIKYSL